MDSIYLSVSLSICICNLDTPKAQLKSDLHGVWFFVVTYAAASVLVLLYLCWVKDLGAYGLFVSRLGTNTNPFSTILRLMAKQYKMWRERCPQQKPLQIFWDKKLLPRSWKHCRMQLQKIKILNECKLQWSLNVPLRMQMGFAQPDMEMSTFCRAVSSGCSSECSSGAMIHPGGESIACLSAASPWGTAWSGKEDMLLTECFPLSSEYLKWRKMNNGERVTTSK